MELEKEIMAIAEWPRLSDDQKIATATTVISEFATGTVEPTVIALLAKQLAQSGEVWQWPEQWQSGDVVSTGGGGSLTTLCCPYLLAGCGCYVPKLSVPGSFAGAIDTLECLHGFRSQPDRAEMRQSLEVAHIAHSKNTNILAPADGFLFALRKKQGRTAVPTLAIASLLSKKLAVSCNTCAVDVRCGRYGNLGHDFETAARNCELYVDVARLLGLRVTCCITDHSFPPMPLFGRLESIDALNDLLNNAAVEPHLLSHFETCCVIAAHGLVAAKLATTVAEAYDIIMDRKAAGDAHQAFLSHLEHQGSSPAALKEAIALLRSSPTYPVYPQRDGILHNIDLRSLNVAIKTLNAVPPSASDRAGIRLLAAKGERVEGGKPLALLRIRKGDSVEPSDEVNKALAAAFVIGDQCCVEHSYGIVQAIRNH